MGTDDQEPGGASITSPKHLDQLARGVLRAARDAARELRRNLRTRIGRRGPSANWQVGHRRCSGQTCRPPLGTAAGRIRPYRSRSRPTRAGAQLGTAAFGAAVKTRPEPGMP